MTHLLDTNTCVRYLNGRAAGVLRQLRRRKPEDIAVCSIVKAELFAGARKSNRPDETLAAQQAFLDRFTSLPFDDPAADHYARIRSELEAAGTPIGPYDLQIAAIALANDLVLVTHNIGEFSRVPALRIEDWEAAP